VTSNEKQKKKTFVFHKQLRTKLLNGQKSIIFHQKSLKIATFTFFSIKNYLKEQPLLIFHKKLFKKTTFTSFSNINDIKNQSLTYT